MCHALHMLVSTRFIGVAEHLEQEAALLRNFDQDAALRVLLRVLRFGCAAGAGLRFCPRPVPATSKHCWWKRYHLSPCVRLLVQNSVLEQKCVVASTCTVVGTLPLGEPPGLRQAGHDLQRQQAGGESTAF